MFKPIIGFEELYEINEQGVVQSLPRSGVRTDGKVFSVPQQVISPYMKKGKPYVQLHRDGKKYCRSVSGLIKETFK